MGRHKRKKNLHGGADRKKASGIAKGDDASATADFTTPEKRRIRQYFGEFRSGAIRVADRRNPPRVPTSGAKTDWRIAGIQLPRLTDQALAGPYLSLPRLSFRQRQFVHECCLDLHLYHLGFGLHSTKERWIAVSIYCDVFPDILGYQVPAYLGFHRSYKPWHCKRQNFAFREETTTAFKSQIQALLDQPGQCLRQTLDTLDFAEWEGKDLSEVAPIREHSGGALEWMLVDSAEKMKQCIQEIKERKPTELAFDLEAYNPSKYLQQTCLLQLSTSHGKEYVIDTLAEGVWDNVGGLAPFFTDPNIVKVGHSIGGLDARCLHRDFGIFICNVFDTYEGARALKLPSHGLASVCQHYGLDTREYANLKGTYQTTDWRKRPLTGEMILYGRYDVHYLLKLRWLMMRDLTHSELFTCGDEEAKLVAESVAATLQRIHDFEDDAECQSTSDYVYDGKAKAYNGMALNGTYDTDDEGEFTTLKKSPDSFEDANNGDSKFILEDSVKTTKIATVDVLRMQPRLMRVLTMSQDRCLDLWTIQAEPHYNNGVLLARTKRPAGSHKRESKHMDNPPQMLTQSQINLYEDLVRLRKHVAARDECLPGFVCSLDDLARIAIGRPTSADALRIISYFLPEALDSMTAQIFALTKKSLKVDGLVESSLDAAVRRYYRRKKSFWLLNTTESVVLASLLIGAIYLAFATIPKRIRK